MLKKYFFNLKMKDWILFEKIAVKSETLRNWSCPIYKHDSPSKWSINYQYNNDENQFLLWIPSRSVGKGFSGQANIHFGKCKSTGQLRAVGVYPLENDEISFDALKVRHPPEWRRLISLVIERDFAAQISQSSEYLAHLGCVRQRHPTLHYYSSDGLW